MSQADFPSPAGREAGARSILDLATPALLLDRTRLERNAIRMQDRIDSLGVRLRQHVKTAKSIEVAHILAGGFPEAITVSTLAEARFFFEHGVRDILYAVGLAPVKLPQVADLVQRGCLLRVIVDSVDAAEAVQGFGAANGIRIEAMIEVDTDGHRAGVEPDGELLCEVARRLASGPGSSLAGVMTHAGGSYDCRERASFEAIAERERSLAVHAAERLRAAGHACGIVSVGSTPTVHYARSLEGVTEARCGVYAFGDLVQAQLGTCAVDDIAISVLASVIGHKPGRILVDAGFLALSRDRGTAALPVDWGYGAVADAGQRLLPGLKVDSTNQEHGMIDAGEEAAALLPVGTRVRIFPNHACATAAAYERYEVTDGGETVVDMWSRVNGW